MVYVVSKNDGTLDSVWSTEAAAVERVGPLSSGMSYRAVTLNTVL